MPGRGLHTHRSVFVFTALAGEAGISLELIKAHLNRTVESHCRPNPNPENLNVSNAILGQDSESLFFLSND